MNRPAMPQRAHQSHMRRTGLVVVFLFAGILAGMTCSPSGQDRHAIGQGALEHVKNLVAFGPRPAGSKALALSKDYIVEVLRRASIQVEVDEWEERGIKFRNILGRIPGESERIVILGSHYDTKNYSGHEDPQYNFRFVGANDAGSSTGLLLELAARIQADRRRKATVWLAFFDGEECFRPEEWVDEDALFGSRRMARRLSTEWKTEFKRVQCLVLLDMVGARDLRFDYDTNSNPQLLALFHEVGRELGYQKHFAGPETGSPIKDDHLPFVGIGIRSIDLIDLIRRQPSGPADASAARHWHTPLDDLPVLSAESLQITGEILMAALPRLERL